MGRFEPPIRRTPKQVKRVSGSKLVGGLAALVGTLATGAFSVGVPYDYLKEAEDSAMKAIEKSVAPVAVPLVSTAPLADNNYVQFAAVSHERINEVALALQQQGLHAYVESVAGGALTRIMIPYDKDAQQIMQKLKQIDPGSEPRLVKRAHGREQPQQYIPSLDEAIRHQGTTQLTEAAARRMLERLEEPKPSLFNLYAEMPFSSAEEGVACLNELKNHGYAVFADDEERKLAVQFRTDEQLDDLMAYGAQHGATLRLVAKVKGEEREVPYVRLPQNMAQYRHDRTVANAKRVADLIEKHGKGKHKRNYVASKLDDFVAFVDSVKGAESDYNHYRISSVHAIGEGQVMPGTALDFDCQYFDRCIDKNTPQYEEAVREKWKQLWDYDTGLFYSNLIAGEAWQMAKGDPALAANIYSRGASNAFSGTRKPRETRIHEKRVMSRIATYFQRMHRNGVQTYK